MKRVALFLFHKDWSVCRNRLELLRRYNPRIQIHGLFGGEAHDLAEVTELFANSVHTLSYVGEKDSRWKWQNTDLAVRGWYRERGHQIDFDTLHVIQWDLLLFDSLANIYAHIPEGVIGLSGLTPLCSIAPRWTWATTEPYKSELIRLKQFACERYSYNEPLNACLGPGYCLPRSFLESYSAVDVPEIGHDEIRIPLFAGILGFKLADTGFYPRWYDEEEERYFNALSVEIDEDLIRAELARADGRRVFHPYRKVFSNLASPRSSPGRDTMIMRTAERDWVDKFIRDKIAGRRGFWHYLSNKIRSDRSLLVNSGLFDADWYVNNNPGAITPFSALDHYIKIGASEGRDPNPYFSTKAYLKYNPDVALSRMNPLLHFVRYGAAEGRRFSE